MYLPSPLLQTDKYQPESACIVGNYYSMKGQHEKVRCLAIFYACMYT